MDKTNREKNVVNYYVLCNKLKNVIRTGWKTWNVQRERLESVAEHIYGVQMLAIAMYSEFKYDIVLMHDTKSYTADALKDIIDYCKLNGYTFKVIDENTNPVRFK